MADSKPAVSCDVRGAGTRSKFDLTLPLLPRHSALCIFHQQVFVLSSQNLLASTVLLGRILKYTSSLLLWTDSIIQWASHWHLLAAHPAPELKGSHRHTDTIQCGRNGWAPALPQVCFSVEINSVSPLDGRELASLRHPHSAHPPSEVTGNCVLARTPCYLGNACCPHLVQRRTTVAQALQVSWEGDPNV